MAQNQEFRGVSRAISQVEDDTHFFYHGTAVVIVKGNGDVILNSGGWRTNTTKLAMNQASNQYDLGFYVYQESGEWFVRFRDKTFHFEDNMTLN